MDTQTLANQTLMTAATASTAAQYWFVFTYLPPASLVGREAEMR